MSSSPFPVRVLIIFGVISCIVLALSHAGSITAQEQPAQVLVSEFASTIKPLLKKYCLDCHSTSAKKGSLDLERFATLPDLRKDLKPWQNMIEQIETGEMPPKKKPQPTEAEKKQLLAWVKTFLDHEARFRSGDPGFVPLRRLSNAEYDYTIRDLTGVDLRPTREFPPDGAAGEGFTNAAEALTDISPALLTKYLNAAKDIADHVVLLPDGFRFSPSKTRRDWTDEGTKRLQQFYVETAPSEGKLPLLPYVSATVRHRDDIRAGKKKLIDIANSEKLNPGYLTTLWKTLNDQEPSLVLDDIRARWQKAGVNEIPALVAGIEQWQRALWKTNNIGNYIQAVGTGWTECHTRQLSVDPKAVKNLPVRLSFKPVPGQNEVVLYLSARDLFPTATGARVIWQRPRFEATGQPALLLKDYSTFGKNYEVNYSAVFGNTANYLKAVAEVTDRKTNVDELASKMGLDAPFLKRWIEVLAADADQLGRVAPLVTLEPLTEKIEKASGKQWINGWKKLGKELPVLMTNASDTAEHIPGNSLPHSVTVHPTPTEFVAVVWKSPIAGTVEVSARITSAHPVCGNGTAWWLEHRHHDRAFMFSEGTNNLGKTTTSQAKKVKVEKGDQIILAIDARNGDHGCDLTDIDLTITETDAAKRTWKLARDVADTIHAGNPHADTQGQPDTWSFVMGPTRPVRQTATVIIPPGSLLHQWREAQTNPARKAEAEKLAQQAQALLTGSRPTGEKDPNRLLYDNLVAVEGVLFQGQVPVHLGNTTTGSAKYGIPQDRFSQGDDAASMAVDANSVVEVRLPAALFAGREFVVEGKLDQPGPERVVQFRVQTNLPAATLSWDGKSSMVASPSGAGFQRVLEGFNQFRELFPLYVCFPNVVPNDEAVTLKMFHREDEPLLRMFLDAEQIKRLNHLWEEHQFVSRQAEAEEAYLPQFIGFVSQDGAPGMLEFFKAQQPNFKQRLEAFQKKELAASAIQLDALMEFAGRAYRRPVDAKEQKELRELYETIRSKGASHLDAVRGVLTRILVSPAFLFRAEHSPVGKAPGQVNDWELATRLSYFLWSSLPDEELRKLAASDQLHEPAILEAQMKRMLKDPHTRALGIEFGAQWIHVRGFDELNEKNEKLFPTFDANLRKAIYEESILFFQDLFQNDRRVTDLLDTDATYLNETLAKHYGIPGVTGPNWRRVEGIKKHGRGGLLGLASVQTKEAGASRTSPVLRGNWMVETLFGEKLPKPPPNVPKLPEEEGGADKLTMRQLVENHTKLAECAGCHQRIDPFGFALEKYDPIGRRREKDFGGLPVDAKAIMKDGSSFDDIDGLRHFLLTKKKDIIIRLFCKRLLGYAFGRMVTLSDTQLLDQMVAALNNNDGRITAAMQVIIQSPQFRMIRGSEFAE
ncbi:MAG TPA: DUF1592 domain-containing protein [Gemmatales bacterium]|nr:DUF1592 domain-containing protein [Gemmatales bacterium]